MTIAEMRAFKLELMDDVWELAQEPVGHPEAIRERVDAFFERLETENGEEEVEVG